MLDRFFLWIKSLFKKKDAPAPSIPNTPREESESSSPKPVPQEGGSTGTTPGALYTEGSKIMRGGKVFILRGVNIPDVSYCNIKDWDGFGTAKENIENAKEKFNCNAIRLPVLPGRKSGKEAWFGLGPDKYWRDHLLPAIKLCNDLGMYALVDFHHISDWNNLVDETLEFWKYIAPKIAGMDMVIAEVFNEPIGSRGWKNLRDKLHVPSIKIIRDAGFKGIILCSTTGWASDMESIKKHEIDVLGENIALVYHFYSNQWPSKVKENIGNAIKEGFPYVCTETGYGTVEHGNTNDFGNPSIDYLIETESSFCLWCHDRSGEWGPQLIKKGTWDLNDAGKTYLRLFK